MVKFIITTVIDQPPEIVWNAYIDPQNMLQWERYLEKVEVVKGKLGEIGAVAHLHYLEKGRSYILTDTLLEYEEGKRILSNVVGQGMDIEVETNFNAVPNGTQISISWNGTTNSFIGRFILRMMQGKIAKQAKAELLTFRHLVETHRVTFPDKFMN
jgi:predicted ester cyclase